MWFIVEGVWYRVQGSGFRVQGSGFRVQGSGFTGFRVYISAFGVDRFTYFGIGGAGPEPHSEQPRVRARVVHACGGGNDVDAAQRGGRDPAATAGGSLARGPATHVRQHVGQTHETNT